MVSPARTVCDTAQARHELDHGAHALAQILIHFKHRVRKLAEPLTPGEQAAAARLADALETAGLLALNLHAVTRKVEGSEG